MQTDATPPAAVAETHGAIVFFVGDDAYKMKKPVNLGFFDFTTRAKRLAVLQRELELNRRIAPDVYLGIVDVVGADGAPVEHLLHMRRLPADRSLSALLRAGADIGGCLDAVAADLAAFHAGAAHSPEIAAAGRVANVRRLWDDGFAELRTADGDVVAPAVLDAAEALTHAYLDGRAGLLDARADAGHVRDGHGDLLCDDVYCLDDGPRVIDCIEFDDTFRWGDVVGDVAFLAMDLEMHGHPELAMRFLAAYVAASGETCPPSLVAHYLAYRAQVRAKIAAIRHAQGAADAADAARAYLDCCLRHLQAGEVRLVLIGGAPGTGKSTVAAGLAERTGWTWLRTDAVRSAADAGAAPVERGAAYDDAARDAVYDRLLAEASQRLAAGETVIADATWGETRWRDAAARCAADTHARLVAVRCELDPDVAAARAHRRKQAGDDLSDAGATVATRLAATFAPWPEATGIDASAPVDVAVAAAAAAAGPAAPPLAAG